MSGEAEPSVPDGADTPRRIEPVERPELPVPEVPLSEVRPSAPTLHEPIDRGSEDRGVEARPVVVRSDPPAAAAGFGPDPATTTKTGLSPRPSSVRPTSARGLVGSTLGRYEVLEEVGHGGMATVYRARDPRLGRDVALKVIHRHLRDNREIAQRFRHEAQAVAKLRHPSIVEIYDVPDEGEDDERYLVAEFVDGPSLRKWMHELRERVGRDRLGLVPPEIAAAIVLQVLSALARAHGEGIVHRDVKPENILLVAKAPGGALATTGPHATPARGPEDREGRRDRPRGSRPSDPTGAPVVKLTDFGIAKILDAQGMTSTGQILGSPAHMAPEQIEAGEITTGVDVFATGVLFYELLTGALPFDGRNPAQVIRRVLDGEFTPPDRLVPTVGGRFGAIVASMLARDPAARPRSVEAVEAALRAELEAVGITDPAREVAKFLEDPAAVAASFGARLVPRLVARGRAAREAGDVVGAANDLNRALAYDPSDPKLIRAVSAMRSRERRLRGLRRGLPLAVLALLVSGGTYAAVRATRPRAPAIEPTPVLAEPASATVSVSNAPPPESTVSARPIASVAPPTVVTTATATTPVVVAPTPDPPVPARRRVRFAINFGAKYRVDGGPERDALVTEDLAVGEHTVDVVGNNNCCESKSVRFRVEPGEGEQVVAISLTLQPHRIFVAGAERARVTVRREGGAILASGPAPLAVPMTDTNVAATVTVEAPGFLSKTETYKLVPGDARYIRLDKEGPASDPAGTLPP
jgi:serine/threonine-protein kinase